MFTLFCGSRSGPHSGPYGIARAEPLAGTFLRMMGHANLLGCGERLQSLSYVRPSTARVSAAFRVVGQVGENCPRWEGEWPKTCRAHAAVRTKGPSAEFGDALPLFPSGRSGDGARRAWPVVRRRSLCRRREVPPRGRSIAPASRVSSREPCQLAQSTLKVHKSRSAGRTQSGAAAGRCVRRAAEQAPKSSRKQKKGTEDVLRNRRVYGRSAGH